MATPPPPPPPPSPLTPLRRLVAIQPKPLASAHGHHNEVARAAAMAASIEQEAKRRKHRLAVKRAYHERLNVLSELRAEEKELEIQYEQLLQHSHRKSHRPDPMATSTSTNISTTQPNAEPTILDDGDGDGDAQTNADRIKELCVRLLDTKSGIERENAALRETSRQHERFLARARIAMASDVVLPVHHEKEQDHHHHHHHQGDEANGETLSPVAKHPPPSPVVSLARPFTLADCCRVIHATWPHVRAFMAHQHAALHLGSQVFGWSHKYRFAAHDENVLQYSISKTFPSVNAYELSQRGWAIMTTQRHYRALHTASMTAQFHLVQRIDNDNLVFLRVLQRSAQFTVFRTLLLASQFQVDRGYMTIYRSLDPALVLEQDDDLLRDAPSAVWLEMFSWTYFEELPSSTRFEFGGEMRHTSRDNARFWMVEVLLMALRWENLAVGPLLTLTSTTEE